MIVTCVVRYSSVQFLIELDAENVSAVAENWGMRGLVSVLWMLLTTTNWAVIMVMCLVL